jgi:hypothetical protein
MIQIQMCKVSSFFIIIVLGLGPDGRTRDDAMTLWGGESKDLWKRYSILK